MSGRRLARALAELVGWGAVAGVGFVMLTQTFGIDRNWVVASLQALTPYGLPLMVVVAAVSVWQRSHALSFGSSLVGLSLMLLSTPIVVPPGQPAPRVGSTEITVAFSNLLFSNPDVAAVGDLLLERDPDAIVFTEYTGNHRADLLAHPLAERYPYKIDRDGLFAGGTAMWSKYPLTENERADTINRTIDGSIEGPDGTIRILSVHPPTPIFDFDSWVGDLDRIGEQADRNDDPILVIGDFNASYWHPVFRDLLRRNLTDAHMASGQGWSASWPTDARVPPFVRLDHALTGHGLVSTDIVDFDAPGSDHKGLIVTVALS